MHSGFSRRVLVYTCFPIQLVASWTPRSVPVGPCKVFLHTGNTKMIFCPNIQVHESHDLSWKRISSGLRFPLGCHQHIFLVSVGRIKWHHGCWLPCSSVFLQLILSRRKQGVGDFSSAGNFLKVQETPLSINLTLESHLKDSHFAISFPES